MIAAGQKSGGHTPDSSSEDELIMDEDPGYLSDQEEMSSRPKKRVRFNSTTTNVEGGTGLFLHDEHDTGAASRGDTTESDTER